MTKLRNLWLNRGAADRFAMLTALLAAACATAFGQEAFRPPRELAADERAKIDAALPERAVAAPAKPRKLLIFDLNVGYPGHGSIAHANYAFTQMGRRTGAFETTVSRDAAAFVADSLTQYDAVFLNNTVGNLFEDPTLRQNLLEFVVGGGGLMGVHGTSVAFTQWPGAREDWPEFGRMIGARGASHRESTEHVFLRVEDAAHPLTKVFPSEGFDYRDEFFRFHDPYSRDRVRVLLSIDTEKTDLEQGAARGRVERADNDYALAWVRNYGRGRVFYSTIAHNPYVFSDRAMLQFYLAATQFALGDLPAPTTPSSRLTPAVKAQEKLGWRLGVSPYSFHKFTLFEALDKTAQLGLSYIGGLSFQKISPELNKDFAPPLTDSELQEIRLKMDSAGVRMLTYYMHHIPGDEQGCRQVFEFARKLGIETLISEPLPETLDTIERFCDEYDIRLAIHNHDQKASPLYWNPEGVLKACEGRSRRFGACGDLGYWMRSGVNPREAVALLGERLITLEMHDLHATGPEGHDVPWGTGIADLAGFLAQVHRSQVIPTMFGLEYSYNFLDNLAEMQQSAEFFHQTAERLAGEFEP